VGSSLLQPRKVICCPVEGAARIALHTIKAKLPKLPGIAHIRFVLFSAADEKAYADALAAS
jgi:O-acetyl-ADP-ribose deacetylase (regulator of RNase III)